MLFGIVKLYFHFYRDIIGLYCDIIDSIAVGELPAQEIYLLIYYYWDRRPLLNLYRQKDDQIPTFLASHEKSFILTRSLINILEEFRTSH